MYELSEEAAADIVDLFEQSVADFGLPQTGVYADSLNRCLMLLGENPEMGAAAIDVRKGYRRFPHRSHVIFYQVTANGIYVIRILHKRMDLAQHID